MGGQNECIPADSTDQDLLEQVIADFIRSSETGASPDRRQILDRHPEIAEDLQQFFAQRDRLNLIAEPIRGFSDDMFRAVGPGQQISYVGNYELVQEIARGGMGIVYKARQTTLGRIVAVKMITAGRLASEDDIRRFHVEAQAVASLQHPNIVAIHEVGQYEGWHYFSMDFVEGRDLSAILRVNVLPARQAATYVRQMAEAIHYAHQQGTLHRDLKPSNVLIDSHDQVRITDFGLAMRVEGNSDLTRTGQAVGTPSYMPPEQAQAKRSLIGPCSDIYSLGAILYECLTGRPPFRAESVIETIQQVIETEAASPRLLNPGIPRDLETICLKCLQKEPHRRYGTAQLLADDLNRFLRGEPITARPINRISRVWRWCRRNSVVASLTSAAAALVLLVAVGATVAYLRETELHAHTEALSDEISQAYGNVTQLRNLEAQLRIDIATEQSLLQQAIARAAHTEQDNAELEAQRHKLAAVLESRQQKLYSTLLYLAQADLEAGNVIRANGYLDDCPENLRDRRWKRLKHLCQPEMRSFPGTKCLAISPDGRWLASVRVRQPEPATIEEAPADATRPESPPIQPRPSSHTGAETEIRFINKTSGDIKLVWIDPGNTQHGYRTIAANQAHAQHTYAGHVWLVTDAKGHNLAVFEAVEGGSEAVVDRAAQERPMETGAAGWEIVVWDFKTGQIVRTIPSHPSVNWLVFHPDNQTLISSSSDAQIRFWEVLSGKLRHSLKEHSAPVTRLSLSVDGRRLASRSERQVGRPWEIEVETFLWNLDTLTLEQKQRGGVLLHPCGDSFVYSTYGTSSNSGQTPKTYVVRSKPFVAHQSASSESLPLIGEHPHKCSPLLFSPDGSLIAIDAGTCLEVWNVAEKQRLFKFGDRGPVHLSFSRDGKRLAYAQHSDSKIRDRTADTVVVRNLHSGEIERILPWYDSPITAVEFSPDGRSLATTDAHGLKVWDVTPSVDPTEEILEDIRQMNVGPLDWPQWGGSPSRMNTPAGERIPSTWNLGEIDAKTGQRHATQNVKWTAKLGSQTYGNPVVANGKVFVGTNNTAGYLKRFPSKVDLGVLLCFKEETGEFLWQHSNTKLPTGRVHDWPFQGVCSTPAVDGDRLWYVTNRCEVVCLDVEGFSDGEDDGVAQGVRQPVFELTANLAASSDRTAIDEWTVQSLVWAMKLPALLNATLQRRPGANGWDIYTVNTQTQPSKLIARVGVEQDELRVWRVADGVVGELVGSVCVDLLTGLNEGRLSEGVQRMLNLRGVTPAEDYHVVTVEPDQYWRLHAGINGQQKQIGLRRVGRSLMCDIELPDTEHEADVVWSLNMRHELGVFPHNMSNCSPLIVGDWLFVCTSNGVDDDHITIRAPDAPSFIAIDRWTGKVLWTDKSPGRNIMHAQWASPSYGVFAGQPQVIFPGGDG